MKETIETRELIVLDGLDVTIRGTYHKTYDDNLAAQSNPVAQPRIGVLFLNSISPTRAAHGDVAVYWADSFAECGYPSFRLDLPGFGDSEGDLPEDLAGFINQGGYASIVSAKVRELVARFNLSGVVIVGQCASGVSALYTAAASPKCKGLVLMDPYFYLPQAKRPVIRREWGTWFLHSRRQFSSIVYDRLKRIGCFLRGGDLPKNANYLLLSSWKKLTPKGLPVLILKGPDCRTLNMKPRAGEFDYLEYLLKVAGRGSKVVVKVTNSANKAFVNHQGRVAVRQHTEQWLNAYFPLVKP